MAPKMYGLSLAFAASLTWGCKTESAGTSQVLASDDAPATTSSDFNIDCAASGPAHMLATAMLYLDKDALKDFDDKKGGGIVDVFVDTHGDGSDKSLEGSARIKSSDLKIKATFKLDGLCQASKTQADPSYKATDKETGDGPCSVEAERQILSAFVEQYTRKGDLKDWSDKDGGGIERKGLKLRGASDSHPSYQQKIRFKNRNEWHVFTIELDKNCKTDSGAYTTTQNELDD